MPQQRFCKFVFWFVRDGQRKVTTPYEMLVSPGWEHCNKHLVCFIPAFGIKRGTGFGAGRTN